MELLVSLMEIVGHNNKYLNYRAVDKLFLAAVLSFDGVYLPVLLLMQNKKNNLTVLFIGFVSLKNKNIKKCTFCNATNSLPTK